MGEFHTRGGGLLMSYCKACDHAQRKVNKRLALEKLMGRPCPEHCEVCGVKTPRERMHWDHNHLTGISRGWLCENCNRALGMAHDQPWILRKLADYLERSGPGPLAYTAWAAVEPSTRMLV